jgi:uncharacterized protein HemY
MDTSSLEKMIENGQDSAMLRLTLARLMTQSDHWDKAQEHLKIAVSLDPEYTAAWKEWGKVLVHLQRKEAAQKAWGKGIEVARSNGDKQAEKEMGVFLRRLSKS